MAVRVIKKSLAGSEDLLLGFGTEVQVRNDKNIEITRINASNIPYDKTRSISEFVNDISITKKVDTLAALRSMTETFDTILVSGYHTKGDGAFGSNIFEWDSTSTEADNGGTIIKLDSVATGRYKLRYSEAVNVKWFGAKGDWNRATKTGTDDTSSIQSALNIVPYGGAVKFPSGEYLISSTLTVGRWCEIYGEGLPHAIQGVQIHTENPDIIMMQVQTETINLHHIGFRGAGRDNGIGNGIGLYITRNPLDSAISHDHRFENLWFNGFNNSGFYTTKIQGSHFVSCSFEFCISGIRCGGSSSPNLSFSNCIISNCRFYANIKAINLYHTAATSMNASSINWNTIIGCVFDFNGNEDKSSSTAQSAIYLGDNCTRNTITGCSFSNQRYFDIYMSRNTGNIVTSCNFNHSGKSAIYLDTVTDTTISSVNINASNYLFSIHSENNSALNVVNSDTIVDNITISSVVGEVRNTYGVSTGGVSSVKIGNYNITGYKISQFLKGPLCKITGRTRSGTFSPFIYGSVVAGTNTYSRANGFYRLTDDGYCEIDIVLILSSYDTATTGVLRLGGLPFVANGTTTRYPMNVGFENSNNVISEAIVYNANNFIRLFKKGALGVNTEIDTVTPLTDTFSVYISGRYRVDIIN